uniref:Alpha-1,3-glucosyltransferase n=1 Tax=Chlamydomonas euryale TaxID=1486919 RepID=A0A7R9VTJ8_9CHLO|mmetsp:Transcript_44161/g.132357  ORF Transcript_44161/g.132357 Transcript_44161/m.132357 type:complete len:187 (+) Transcript_44161:1545-2105(+)
MLQQALSPSPHGLLLCMANSAAAFYMFAFQVHEKSVLLPLLPLCALADKFPFLALWGPVVGAFSVWPLLWRDGVVAAYAAACAAYLALMWRPTSGRLDAAHAADARPSRVRWLWPRVHRACGAGLAACMAVLHAARLTLAPPEALPWLHDRVFVSFAFCALGIGWVWLQLSQWVPAAQGSAKRKSA